jgi:restriction system protein
MGRGARKGVLITTSGYSKEAIAYVDGLQNLSIVLIDGTQLAELMIDHSVGVAVEVTYIVKRMDLDYFEETV